MRWHYIITLGQPARDLAELPATATYAGVVTLDPRATRNAAYLDVYGKYAAMMIEESGRPEAPNTMFFSLEPDTLES